MTCSLTYCSVAALRRLLWRGLALVLILVAGHARAQNSVITVGGINCRFQNLLDAVDYAANRPGADTIRVTIGFTSQALVINDPNPLTIEGESDACADAPVPALVPISGIGGTAGTPYSVVKVIGNADVTLRHLEISNGRGAIVATVPSGSRGGGVFHAGSGLLTLEGVTVRNNTATFGGGVAVEGTGSARLLDTQVRDNDDYRGGLYFASSGSLAIASSAFTSSARSAGLWVEQTGHVSITDSTFAQNAREGLRVENASGPLDALRLDIRANRVGGIVLAGSGAADFRDVAVTSNGVAGSPGRAVELVGTGPVSFHGSTIQGNFGSGITQVGSGQLAIDTTLVDSNSSGDNGGGIAVVASGTTAPTLRFGPGVRITRNLSTARGGGMYLQGVDFDATQAGGYTIANNEATGSGGGVAVIGGIARFGSGDAAGGVVANVSRGNGGGLYASGGARVFLFTTDPAAPVSVLRNFVSTLTYDSNVGGGIAVESLDGDSAGTMVYAFDARIEGNTAQAGGGVALLGSSLAKTAGFCLGRAIEPDSCLALGSALPSGARPCAVSSACNRIDDNEATGPYLGGGAVLRLMTGPPRPLRLSGARVEHNRGRTIIASDIFSGASLATEPLEILDSLLTGNTATGAVLGGLSAGVPGVPEEWPYILGNVVVARSTIAANVVGANHVIGSRTGLTLEESIVYQPGTSVHAGNPSGATARNVLAHEITSLPPRSDVIAGDPLLQAGGVPGDLVPAAGSPALDFSSGGSGNVDLAGRPRGEDIPSQPNRFGPRDLGAFERPASDRIFANGFQ